MAAVDVGRLFAGLHQTQPQPLPVIAWARQVCKCRDGRGGQQGKAPDKRAQDCRNPGIDLTRVLLLQNGRIPVPQGSRPVEAWERRSGGKGRS